MRLGQRGDRGTRAHRAQVIGEIGISGQGLGDIGPTPLPRQEGEAAPACGDIIEPRSGSLGRRGGCLMPLDTCLFFDGRRREAVEFHRSVFRGGFSEPV